MLVSKLGVEFRDLIDAWDQACIREDKYSHIRMLVDAQNFLLFFVYEDDVYGTTEQHRVTFAKMKSPDEDATIDWLKDANFVAFNLSKGIAGKSTQDVFYLGDIKDIEVISKDQAYDILKQQSEDEDREKVVSGTQTIVKAIKAMQNKPQVIQGED